MLVDGDNFIFSNLLNVSQMDLSNVFFSNGLAIADFTVDRKASQLEWTKMLLKNQYIKIINIVILRMVK